MTRSYNISAMSTPQDRFSREMTDGIPLEKLPAIEPLWKSIASGFGLAVFLLTVILVLG